MTACAYGSTRCDGVVWTSLRVVGGGETIHRMRQCKRKATTTRLRTRNAFCSQHFKLYSLRD